MPKPSTISRHTNDAVGPKALSLKDPALDRSRAKATLSSETLAALRDLQSVETLGDFRELCYRNEQRLRRRYRA